MDFGEGPLYRETTPCHGYGEQRSQKFAFALEQHPDCGIDFQRHRNSLQSSAGLELDLVRSVP
jgi:hypothetical protein